MSIMSQLLEKAKGSSWGKKDPILSIPKAILTLEEKIANDFDQIRGITLFSVDDETGQPIATGFSSEIKANVWKGEIAMFDVQMDALSGVLSEIEEVFEKAGLPPMTMRDLDNRISDVQEAPQSIAIKITGRVMAMIRADRSINLALVWADPEIQSLEVDKTKAFQKMDKELAVLMAVKNDLHPLVEKGRLLVQSILRPTNPKNPATVAEMEGRAWEEKKMGKKGEVLPQPEEEPEGNYLEEPSVEDVVRLESNIKDEVI